MTIPKRVLQPIALLAGVLMCACGGGAGNQATRNTDVVLPAGVSQLTFPKGFLFGTGTSSYQVEGAYDQGGRGLSDWDVLAQGGFANGQTGNVADDFYHHYKEDVALMAKMGVKSFRFSIAWPRIFPTGFSYNADGTLATPNPEGIAFYSDLIDELQAHGIEPLVTLYHWDMPLDLWGYTGANGFANRMVVNMFAGYCQTVFAAYGNRVNYWLTLNEPLGECSMLDGIISVALQAQASGQPVSLSNLMAMFKAMPGDTLMGRQLTDLHNYLYCSSMATMILRQMKGYGLVKPGAMIGPVLDARLAKSSSNSAADLAATELYNHASLDMTLLPLTQGAYPADVISRLKANGYDFDAANCNPAQDLAMMKMAVPDFIGVNYYTRATITSSHTDTMFPITGGLGTGAWFNTAFSYNVKETPEAAQGPYDPQGLYDTLKYVHEKSGGLPILITENGCSYPGEDVLTDDGHVHDTLRMRYLDGHLKAVWKAQNDGIPVLGYTAWAQMDNFEWFSGYNVRYGLTYVDYTSPSLTRTPKDSYYWYSNVIKNNGLSAD